MEVQIPSVYTRVALSFRQDITRPITFRATDMSSRLDLVNILNVTQTMYYRTMWH